MRPFLIDTQVKTSYTSTPKRGFLSHHMNRRLCMGILAMFLILSATGCGISTQQQGVHNKWRDQSILQFEKGRTSQSDILAILGPPSQVIALADHIVFYYMMERIESTTAILILFNWTKKDVSYDRAIFFFDRNGILTEYAYSLEQIPYEKIP